MRWLRNDFTKHSLPGAEDCHVWAWPLLASPWFHLYIPTWQYRLIGSYRVLLLFKAESVKSTTLKPSPFCPSINDCSGHLQAIPIAEIGELNFLVYNSTTYLLKWQVSVELAQFQSPSWNRRPVLVQDFRAQGDWMSQFEHSETCHFNKYQIKSTTLLITKRLVT